MPVSPKIKKTTTLTVMGGFEVGQVRVKTNPAGDWAKVTLRCGDGTIITLAEFSKTAAPPRGSRNVWQSRQSGRMRLLSRKDVMDEAIWMFYDSPKLIYQAIDHSDYDEATKDEIRRGWHQRYPNGRSLSGA